MKSTAIAPSNIAFIKYWGKVDEKLRLPLNDSFSMNLSETYTTTTIDFSSKYMSDHVTLVGETLTQKEKARIIIALDRIRQRAQIHIPARVVTKNSFPKGTGVAASASGFAALTVSGFSAAGVQLTEKELTIFARLGSGSACRSIPDGFVLWERGTTSETSFAHSIFPYNYWDLYDVLVIVDTTIKKVSSTEGQEKILTSPLWEERIRGIPEKIDQIKGILEEKNFPLLGELIEEECLSLHRVMQTQVPPLFYWNSATKKLMKYVKQWREEGIPVYFTIDAGPNVHLICEKPTVPALKKKLENLEEIKTIIVSTSTPGAHLIDQHLF